MSELFPAQKGELNRLRITRLCYLHSIRDEHSHEMRSGVKLAFPGILLDKLAMRNHWQMTCDEVSIMY